MEPREVGELDSDAIRDALQPEAYADWRPPAWTLASVPWMRLGGDPIVSRTEVLYTYRH